MKFRVHLEHINKFLLCYLDYNLAHCHYLTNTGRDNTTQMLNAMVGCQLMKGLSESFGQPRLFAGDWLPAY